ncbi:transcription initiation factor TFIID subunit 8-like [Homarus americanus]|uniref:Transcription initiation factor TFIID subunit 8 n=1 Tax=Homarus americanus TaxID=6706 RepID=A0A8J5MX74_HOMAM|nr:transcription initiation factor TFIID subunit 8-like [Homarus americanus]KAG7166279.1 Transcription initiation factor TFIID subunit 8-like [Homarus americanus]
MQTMAALPTGVVEIPATVNPRRKTLASAVGGIVQESGFLYAEKAAMGTLTEMLQSLISEIGRSSKAFCEQAYRTEPVVGDVVMALIDMGISIEGLQAFRLRQNRVVIAAPAQQVDLKQHNVLQVGDKKSHPQHIPDHLPPFPDTHTYCFSHTYKQPVTEYEAIREKAAAQKRDIERALTKFAAKTSDTQNLFFTDDKEFMLVGVTPNSKSYLDALMPRDQVFEEEEERTRTKKRRMVHEEGDPNHEKDRMNETQDAELDNPYLRPVKMPRKPKVKK